MLHGTFVFLPFLETDKEATIMPTSVRTNFQSLKEIQQAAANVAHSVRNKFIGTDCRIETEERMSRRIKSFDTCRARVEIATLSPTIALQAA